MLDAFVPRDVGDVDEAINALFDLDERAEVRQVTHTPVDARADLVTLFERLPRIRLRLLHAETDAPRARVNAQHFGLNLFAHVHQLRRLLRPLQPTHLRDVDEAFDARLKLDERAVVGHARNHAFHARADNKTLLDRFPRIRQQLFVTETDALAFAVELQNFDLHVLADLEHLARILQ